MPLTKVELEQFTAFAHLEMEFSPGINAFVGTNGTGKTHLMKVCYAACDSSKSGIPFAEKLARVFLPSRNSMARLRHRQGKASSGWAVKVHRNDLTVQAVFPAKRPNSAAAAAANAWRLNPVESVYIPVKDMLANAPGFPALYAAREIHFDEVYVALLNRAYLPMLRPATQEFRRNSDLKKMLQKEIGGRVIIKGEEFFLRGKQGAIEFTLVAEGFRKLGLLWLLIQNGTLREGSILFWDEPETNLNPKLFKVVMQTLLELQRAGVQIFLATHDYVVLEELDLQKTDKDEVLFHSLYHDDAGAISCNASSSYLGMAPNAIAEVFDDLYDREIERSLGGLLK